MRRVVYSFVVDVFAQEGKIRHPEQHYRQRNVDEGNKSKVIAENKETSLEVRNQPYGTRTTWGNPIAALPRRKRTTPESTGVSEPGAAYLLNTILRG